MIHSDKAFHRYGFSGDVSDRICRQRHDHRRDKRKAFLQYACVRVVSDFPWNARICRRRDRRNEMLEVCFIKIKFNNIKMKRIKKKKTRTYLLSRCLSWASTRRKFNIDASCGFKPKNCSLGKRSALMREVIELSEFKEFIEFAAAAAAATAACWAVWGVICC